MTKSKIKAALRRSAKYDSHPMMAVNAEVFNVLKVWRMYMLRHTPYPQFENTNKSETWRLFMLLVAEAIQ